MVAKKIPNIITLCNLLCGCMSITYAFQGHLRIAACFILLAAVFDFLDGVAARIFNAQSPMGGELDSLSDVVSFGVAPSVIAYLMLASQAMWGHYWACLAFVMAAASSYRLARFNVGASEDFFRGMPTPANAMFWAALALHGNAEGDVLKGGYLLALVAVMSFLLVSNYRMFSFKMKDRSWRAQKVVYVFMGLVVILFVLFGFLGLAGAIVMYPFFSWLHFYLKSRNLKNFSQNEI